MRHLRDVVLATMLLPAALLIGAPAARADIGPDQAQALTSQLHDWLRGLVGPAAALPDLRATAEGDHYLLTVPIDALSGRLKDITANLRPLDGGRWAADDIRLPADATFTAKLRPPNGGPGPVDVPFHLSIAGQDSHGVLDPTFATPSTLELGLVGVGLDSEDAARPQRQRFGLLNQTLVLRPAADGKLDIDQDSTVDGWESAQAMPDGHAVAVAAGRLAGSVRIVGLDRAQAATMGPVLSALAAAPTPERNERLRALVVALHGLLTSVRFGETIEHMRIAVAGQGTAEIGQVHLGFDSAAPQGNVAARVAVGLDGLALPDIPPGAATLAPKHVELSVSVAGLASEALNNLALAALAPGADAQTLAPQIDALFANPGQTGGPRLGIDTLGFDLGPAQIEGHGSVVAVSQSDVRGTARITMTGFDALADQIRTDPALQQALPFLILARGLARSEGQTLIWDIVFAPGGVTVNGVDPTTLMQGQKHRQKP
jgi:hypothetical protein